VSAPSTIIASSSWIDRDGHLADTACSRRCHASIKSRQTSPTGDERQNKGSQAQPGRQPQRQSARRRSGPSPPRRTSPTSRNPNSKPRSSSAATFGSLLAALPLIVQPGSAAAIGEDARRLLHSSRSSGLDLRSRSSSRLACESPGLTVRRRARELVRRLARPVRACSAVSCGRVAPRWQGHDAPPVGASQLRVWLSRSWQQSTVPQAPAPH
jgi:hypothetical protein